MDNEKHVEELAYLRTEVKRLRRTLNELSPDINMLLKRRKEKRLPVQEQRRTKD